MNDLIPKPFSASLLVKYGKVLVFLLLVLVEVLLFAGNWNGKYYAGIVSWYVLLPATVFLLAENAVKLWGVKSMRAKIPCYVCDVLTLLVLTLFTDGNLISTLYIIILSEFYLTQTRIADDIVMAASCMGLFLITSALAAYLNEIELDIGSLISGIFNDLLLITFHFLVFNFTIQIYRKNREITAALEELNDKNEKLEAANSELKEVAALEERQRIAKDIHDTAGHSITTVIMQTEAARLVLDDDPEDAKRKIAAANLQAKHALEELRESVHLLSGSSAGTGIRDAVMQIVHDSTDGTGITIRTDVEEIELCDAKRRLVLNTLKEGISNGLRHGGATAFYFELRQQDGHIGFLLSDNGAGSDIADLKEGFGLRGMHRRAESLGGDVWFETERGEGFEIHMTLPPDGGKGEKV